MLVKFMSSCSVHLARRQFAHTWNLTKKKTGLVLTSDGKKGAKHHSRKASWLAKQYLGDLIEENQQELLHVLAHKITQYLGVEWSNVVLLCCFFLGFHGSVARCGASPHPPTSSGLV